MIKARLAAIPGGGDLYSLLRFLDPANKKEFTAQIEQLDARTQAHLDAVALHGKAEEIERIHEEAKAWEQRAIDQFAKREADLKAAQQAFAEKQAKAREEWNEMEAGYREAREAEKAALRSEKQAIKAREDALAPKEAELAAAMAAARKMHDEGLAAKELYEKMMKGIQNAVNV